MSESPKPGAPRAFQHIAALGSSFAAGPGIFPLADRRAERSTRNYPHLLAALYGAKLTDLTISGATTTTILNSGQKVARRIFPAQIEGITDDVDLVTLTAGGNDLNYVGSLIKAGIIGRLHRHAIARPIARAFARNLAPRPTATQIENATQGLVSIVSAIRDRAPGARVVLVDYLTIIGPGTQYSAASPFDAETVAGFHQLGNKLNEVFRQAAERSAADLVQVSAQSLDHAVGAREPWVNGLTSRKTGAAPFHPNAAGMRAVASAIHRHLDPGIPTTK